jgi:hypothetical protein
MASESTTVIGGGWSRAAPTTPQGAAASTEALGGPAPPVTVFRQIRGTDKEAILEALYAERRLLTRTARERQLDILEQQHLNDVERYIDSWEAEEAPEQGSDEVWRKLSELTESMLTLRASLGRSAE